MLVQSLVDGSAPDGGLFFWEGVLDVLNAFWGSKDTCHVDMFRVTLGDEGLHTHLHADAGSEHWVGDDECLVCQVWRSKIFDVDTDLGMLLVGIFAVSTHKGIARVVEDIEKTLMERKTGTEDGSDDDLVGREVDPCYTERCSHIL